MNDLKLLDRLYPVKSSKADNKCSQIRTTNYQDENQNKINLENKKIIIIINIEIINILVQHRLAVMIIYNNGDI